ncbi:unnamed protein product, partial [Medioppia subpectinata]
MFANYLPADINVYALAASRPDEYGAQYSYDYLRRAFTASYFATMWFENSQIYYLDMESLNDQYQYIADRSNLTISGWWPPGTNTTFVMDWTQHAQQYGDKHIGQQHVSEYMGKLHSGVNYAIDSEVPELADLADNRNVSIHLAQMNIALSEDIDEKLRTLFSSSAWSTVLFGNNTTSNVKYLYCDMIASIVFGHSVVNIGAITMVYNNARRRVDRIVSYIIDVHNNYIFIGNTLRSNQLVRVLYLNKIVEPFA